VQIIFCVDGFVDLLWVGLSTGLSVGLPVSLLGDPSVSLFWLVGRCVCRFVG
jgi:hypothetical protein